LQLPSAQINSCTKRGTKVEGFALFFFQVLARHQRFAQNLAAQEVRGLLKLFFGVTKGEACPLIKRINPASGVCRPNTEK
jgi:hypothetical protein